MPWELNAGFSRGLRIQETGEDGRRLLPFLGFFFNLFAAGSRKLVKLRLPIIVRETPCGGDASLLFQLQQCWVKRSVVDGQKISARLFDLARNPVAMQRTSPFERFQNHQRQSSLPNIGFAAHRADDSHFLLECNR